MSQIPTWGYLQQPRSFLHYTDARIKQLWLCALLVTAARGSVPAKTLSSVFVVLLSVAALPQVRRATRPGASARPVHAPYLIHISFVCASQSLWRAQLSKILFLGSLLMLGLVFGSDLPPVTEHRGLPASVEGLPAVR